MEKLKISAVRYLNTKPFIYGLFRSDLADEIDLTLDIPARCAAKLVSGEADLVLAPVAVIPELPDCYLVSDYCIGSTGAVQTVCIFSDKPLAEIRRLYLDFHSKTSVALAKILCARYWNIQPEFIPATEGFETCIGGDTAGLVIGDRAIGLEKKYRYTHDLGEIWTRWTGLPFVFAAWISARPLDQTLVARFNEALETGLSHLPELIKILPTMPGDFDLDAYFRHNISYALDEMKWAGLNRFLEYLDPEKRSRLHRNSLELTL
jgi:chorismate dehydratase